MTQYLGSLAKENVPISSIIHCHSTEELAHVGFPAVSLWAGSRNLTKASGHPSHMKSVTSSYAYSRHSTLCQELVQGNITADDKCNLSGIQKVMLMHCIRLSFFPPSILLHWLCRANKCNRLMHRRSEICIALLYTNPSKICVLFYWQ